MQRETSWHLKKIENIGVDTHRTPLECKPLGIGFSIDIALRWSAGR